MTIKTASVLEPLLASPKLLLKLKAGGISSAVVTDFTIPVAAIFDRKLKNQALGQLLKI